MFDLVGKLVRQYYGNQIIGRIRSRDKTSNKDIT